MANLNSFYEMVNGAKASSPKDFDKQMKEMSEELDKYFDDLKAEMEQMVDDINIKTR